MSAAEGGKERAYEVRVWQHNISIEWLYRVEAVSAEDAIRKAEAGEITDGPTEVDSYCDEGDDYSTARAQEAEPAWRAV